MRTILTYKFLKEINTKGKDEDLIKTEVIEMLVKHLESDDAKLFDAFIDHGPKDNPDDIFMPISDINGERISIIDIVKDFDYDFDVSDFRNHESELNELLLEQLKSKEMILENFWVTSEGNLRHTYFNLGTES